jgi:hypothetical protein
MSSAALYANDAMQHRHPAEKTWVFICLDNLANPPVSSGHRLHLRN